jgi:plasmid stabilization system protein ParE
MREIRLLEPADVEFHDARRYYESCQSGLGDEFAAAVEQKLYSIQQNPKSYAAIYANVREAIVARFPYAIYFTISDESIDVWAVFHQSRDPAVWQGRLKD